MNISWQDLTDDERTALKRMNRGPYPNISLEMGQRLVALGLAEMRATASASAGSAARW